MKRVGIFGGSFDPIHNCHIRLIKEILKKNLVDEVWIIPCKSQAFNKELAPAKDRIKMLKLAIKGIKKVKIDLIEINSKKRNYTILTINKLKKRESHKFLLIVGSDISKEITKWYKHEEIFEKVAFIVFKRKGSPITNPRGMKIYAKVLRSIGNISSAKIRQRIAQGKRIRGLVPPRVEEYIKENRLYRQLRRIDYLY